METWPDPKGSLWLGQRHTQTMWYVYFLQSKKNQHYYIGVTENLSKRLQQHNLGKTKSTKSYRPWQLVYNEAFDDINKAYKREYFLKHPKGYQDKLVIIRSLKHGDVAQRSTATVR